MGELATARKIMQKASNSIRIKKRTSTFEEQQPRLRRLGIPMATPVEWL
jgi:hypothetical protein